MHIIVNGHGQELSGQGGLLGLLSELGVVSERVAVMVNDVIIPKTRRHETVLREGDRVEILTFVGGG